MRFDGLLLRGVGILQLFVGIRDLPDFLEQEVQLLLLRGIQVGKDGLDLGIEPPADFEVKRPHLLVGRCFLAVGAGAFVLELLGDAMRVEDVAAG